MTTTPPTPAMIAREHLDALHQRTSRLGVQVPDEMRIQVGLLAAQVEIADRLKEIEQILDFGIKVRRWVA